MSDSADDAIAVGRAASARLRDRDRATWADWLDVARAIAIGRTAALKVAGTNCPVGTRYNTAMRNWKRPTTALRQERSFHLHCASCLSSPFVIFVKRQALLARFRPAQIRGFKLRTSNYRNQHSLMVAV
jgi:hypothetical protein